MNLDDALAGAERAKQYPVAPSMPIKTPSDPQQPSSRGSHQTSSGGSSNQQQPQSGGQVSTSQSQGTPAVGLGMHAVCVLRVDVHMIRCPASACTASAMAPDQQEHDAMPKAVGQGWVLALSFAEAPD